MWEENRHWEDGDLLRKLYGLEPEGAAPDKHLASCAECSRRWDALRRARAEMLNEAGAGEVPEARLREQRRALWTRIDHPRRFWLSKWAPVAATAVMLTAGFVLMHPARPLPPPVAPAGSGASAQISDAELFSDLSAIASPAAPKAAEPIRGLFQDSNSDEEGSY